MVTGQFGDNVGFLGAQGNFLRSCERRHRQIIDHDRGADRRGVMAATGSTNELVTDAVLQALATAELVE